MILNLDEDWTHALHQNIQYSKLESGAGNFLTSFQILYFKKKYILTDGSDKIFKKTERNDKKEPLRIYCNYGRWL